MHISIIGFGNMSQYLSQGLLRDERNQLCVSAPSLPVGVTANGIQTHHDNKAIIPDADVVLLAVKPAVMPAVLLDIAPVLSAKQLVISVAAGLPLSWFAERLPKNTAIIRAMPNLAAKCAQSATPLIANAFVTDTQKKRAERVFLSSGIITWTEQESDIDTFTALSGSGIAYLFAFMQAMVSAAVELGLSESLAKTITLQTVQGAVSLANTEQQSLQNLKHAVTSKGGTTAAALAVFEACQLDEIVLKAMKAAYQRSQELGAF